MLKDVKLMIDFITELATKEYGKEVFFYNYDDDTWYSRDHCREVEVEEILDWLKERVYPFYYESEENHPVVTNTLEDDSVVVLKCYDGFGDKLEVREETDNDYMVTMVVTEDADDEGYENKASVILEKEDGEKLGKYLVEKFSSK